MNYYDASARIDVLLAEWHDKRTGPVSVTLELQHILTEVKATSDLKSMTWLVPQVERTIAMLAVARTKEVRATT